MAIEAYEVVVVTVVPPVGTMILVETLPVLLLETDTGRTTVLVEVVVGDVVALTVEVEMGSWLIVCVEKMVYVGET